MKNINFHSLKNTPVPEELKQSVIAVPERSGTKRKVYPGRMIRFAVAFSADGGRVGSAGSVAVG